MLVSYLSLSHALFWKPAGTKTGASVVVIAVLIGETAGYSLDLSVGCYKPLHLSINVYFMWVLSHFCTSKSSLMKLWLCLSGLWFTNCLSCETVMIMNSAGGEIYQRLILPVSQCCRLRWNSLKQQGVKHAHKSLMKYLSQCYSLNPALHTLHVNF